MWDGILAFLGLLVFLYMIQNYIDRTQKRIERIENDQLEIKSKLWAIEKRINPKRDEEYI